MCKTFLVVFHGKLQNGKITDISDDPCFSNPPSWGICRPNIRKAIMQNDIIIFIAKFGNEYYLKGWFKVGAKIDYVAALNKFPSRLNVMLSTIPSQHNIKWRYDHLMKCFTRMYGERHPDFLTKLVNDGVVYYQNPLDEHEIDNWKCRRIYNCSSKQFEHCIENNICLKSNASLKNPRYMNYVVADKDQWEDLDYLNIKFKDIATAIGFPFDKLTTPKGQHNVHRIDEYTGQFFNFIANKKSEAVTTESETLL